MKKRALSVLLAIALLVGMLPAGMLSASAYSDTDIPYAVEGGNIYFDKETGTITGCDERVTEANIPAKIDGVAVTSIGDRAFAFCTRLKSITIPDGVISIGEYAFFVCDSLKSINIPNSVTSISDYAFGDCTWLPSITIPDGVISIGNGVFHACSNLESVTLGSGVTHIGDDVFESCHRLMRIWVDAENEKYSSDINGVFYNKDKTLLILCPTGYSGSYTIGDGVTSIGHKAFYQCKNLTSLTIGNGITDIGDETFAYCDNLESVTIGSSVVNIGASAFLECKKLKSIIIPDSVISIGSFALGGCSGLESLTMGSNVTTIGDCAFQSCSSLKNITIPDSMISIGNYAFNHCHSLTGIMIPGSVTSIGDMAFQDCSSLTGIWVDEESESFSNDECGVLYNKDKTILVRCPGGYRGHYTIPDSVTSIGIAAFGSCGMLTSVTILGNVTSIGNFAFLSCNNLTEIYFMGPAPVLGDRVFTASSQPRPGLTFYYIEGAEGWTTPTWNGYPTVVWDPNAPSDLIAFDDVPYDAWYYDAVEYAVRSGLFNGMSETTFEPDTPMTRAMLVTVLWRYAGEPMEGENTFTDVPAGQWYTDAVAWAAHNSIVGGVGDNKFDPNGNITREQMATILFRYASAQGIDTSARANLIGFPDAGSVSAYANDPLCWAVAERLISGSDGKLLPQGNATRAQVATILMRFIENVVE